MEVIRKPLTEEEAIERMDYRGFIEGVVPIPLRDIIMTDGREFKDLVAKSFVEDPLLLIAGIDVFVVGHERFNVLLIEIVGDMSMSVYTEEDRERGLL